MINVSELITDPDFCQTISFTRYTNTIVNHRVVETPTQQTTIGVIIALDSNKDTLNETSDNNFEEITLLTSIRMMTVGKAKDESKTYGSDIVHYKGANYIVRSCQDLSEYGYFRSKAYKIEQDIQ